MHGIQIDKGHNEVMEDEIIAKRESEVRKKEQLVVPIHFGKMVHTAWFATFDKSIKKGDNLLIKSDRGTELGTALSQPINSNEIKEEIFGKVVRHSRLTERSKVATNRDGVEREMKYFCQNISNKIGLSMKIQDVEFLLGGERIIFFFTSEGRIDFRQLIKDLANEYHTRIEMRQIGNRENAKLFGGFGKCGMELCCTTWLKDFPDVNMKMAIVQKGSTENTKVNGKCGKLMCCLQYEDDLYQKFKEQLPNRGQMVKTNANVGEVVSLDILNQKVTFVNDLHEYITVHASEIIATANKDSSVTDAK